MDAQKKSLEAVGKMVEGNGGKWFRSLHKMIDFVNAYHISSNGLARDLTKAKTSI